MRVRTLRSLPARPALLALSALLGCIACPAMADEPLTAPASATPAEPAPPKAPPPRSPFRLHATPPAMSMTARFQALDPETDTLGAKPSDANLPATRSQRMTRAFAAEMRDEAITSRRAALYATIPVELPELLEDDYIRKQQSRVAESVIGDAVEAAVSEGFFGGRHTKSSLNIRPMFAVADHGIKLDASPSWSYRVRAPRSGFHVDLPLIPSTVRFNAYRDLRGTNRTPMRLGAGVLIDPFDEEIRCGLSLKF